MIPAENTGKSLRIEKAVYGGDGLAHTAAGEAVLVPFALPGESVYLTQRQQGRDAMEGPSPLAVLEASPDRTAPRCVHFGVCGGCQYQIAAYPAQLAMKEAILGETLARAGVSAVPPVQRWASPEPYGYRNRIRMRVRRVGGELRFGYSVRETKEFLPITMCPIAAPPLWRSAEALLAAAGNSRDMAHLLDATEEVELFCDGDASRVQATMLCVGKLKIEANGFARAVDAARALCPELSGAGAVRVDPRSGRALDTLASWGAAGMAYTVGDETYWITRGGFFQVNRFLLPTLVRLVCGERRGELAWDLYAGVGLFSRVLARRFEAVTAVEANPAASAEAARALAKLGPQHRAIPSTTLDFLQRAVLEREQPELVVLDPPRAGAGAETCAFLARLAPPEIVYLSCDPTTLARDLAVLTGAGYRLTALHLIDLFPQTYHLETLAVLCRDVGDWRGEV